MRLTASGLFAPLNMTEALLAPAAAIAILRFRFNSMLVLGTSAAAGIVPEFAGLA